MRSHAARDAEGAERRGQTRFPTEGRATLLWTGDDGKYRKELIQILDKSLDGVGIQLTHPLPVGLAVWIEEDQGLTKAEVRHCRPAEGGYVTGLRKTGLAASAGTTALIAFRNLLPTLTFVLLTIAICDIVTLRSEIAPGLVTLSLIAAAACAGLSVLTHRGKIPAYQIHSLAAAVMAITLFTSAMHVYVCSDPYKAIVMVLLLTGAGHTLHSLKWLAAIQLSIIVSWVCAGGLALPESVWQPVTLHSACRGHALFRALLAAAGSDAALRTGGVGRRARATRNPNATPGERRTAALGHRSSRRRSLVLGPACGQDLLLSPVRIDARV